MNALVSLPVYVMSLDRRMAESFFRNEQCVKVLQSVEALTGVEGTGRTLFIMSQTFAGRPQLYASMVHVARTRRFSTVKFV